MRLTEIEAIKAVRSRESQPLFPAPAQLLAPDLNPAPAGMKQRLARKLAPWLLPFRAFAAERAHGRLLPEVTGCHYVVGHRFADDWACRRFALAAGGWQGKRVLLPGAHFNSGEARDWFRRPVSELHLLDIVDWTPSLNEAQNQVQALCRGRLFFHHGTLDRLPLPDASMDMMESRAVLEHVGNMRDTAAEMARVLVPGGLALHSIGPLYYCHGGDHCIGAYGLEHGYDHLLLDDDEYTRRLMDEAAFQSFGREASDARYWAIQKIFSYLKPAEYLEAFAPWFECHTVLAKISAEALAFRKARPEAWMKLLATRLTEADLLIDGLTVILKKTCEPG